MSEEYRFMRYWLPGSLFLVYLLTLIVPNLENGLGQQTIIGFLVGALIASPMIGFIIYAFYNEFFYEHKARIEAIRGALSYIKNGEPFTNYKEDLKCFIQKKELLDLIYHSTLEKEGEVKIGPEIIGTLKSHLNAFSARVVCGFFVPVFSLATFIPSMILLDHFDVEITWNLPFLILITATIDLVSIVLLKGHMRVLREAYQLEEYFVKAKKKEIKELLKALFPKK